MGEKDFVVKVHNSYRDVIGICDRELVGEKIEEGEKQLDLTGQFFKGEEKNLEELKDMIMDGLKEDSTFNLVGEKSCAVALEMKLIDKEGIQRINGVPFALVLL